MQALMSVDTGPETPENPSPHSSESRGPVAFDLEELWKEHSRSVYRAAYRVTGNKTDAEDVVQTIFLRLLKQKTTVEGGPRAASYLYRAGINAGLDLLRSRKRARTVDLEEGQAEHTVSTEPAADPERGLASMELRERLREALLELSPRSAEIFAMRYFQELGNHEIADMLGTSRSSVAVTLHRARHRLKEELGGSP